MAINLKDFRVTKYSNLYKSIKPHSTYGYKYLLWAKIDGKLHKKIFTGINAYYHDDPFYRALFLFGFTGRRKSEILNLKWENIDFKHNYYSIEDIKTDDQQKYQLPH